MRYLASPENPQELSADRDRINEISSAPPCKSSSKAPQTKPNPNTLGVSIDSIPPTTIMGVTTKDGFLSPDPEKGPMTKKALGVESAIPASGRSSITLNCQDRAGFGSETEGDGEVIAATLKVSLRERLRHFTFAWYTLTMSTGGISLLLALLPHRFPGLTTIGTIIFILSLTLQTLITLLLCLRFILFPSSIYPALTQSPEAMFVGTFFLSLAATLSNISIYGIPQCGAWLPVALRVCFWIYLAVTFLVSILQYDRLFRNKSHLSASSMTPAWILPIFPVMLAGTLAGFFSPSQPAGHALAILAAGAAAQGLGMLVSVFFYGTYLTRLMAHGLPDLRPGMFIAVGPPSFTAAALVSMGGDIPRVLSATSTEAVPVVAALELSQPELLGEAFRLVCLGSAVFLWGLSFWFCALSLAGLYGMPDAKFHLSWWSFVFPNVGFTIATLRIGEAAGSDGVEWLGIVMAAILTVVWMGVGGLTVKAVGRREIAWPGRDEDVPHH
ncbi:C4-dicarboxylate transporter/malic acid transporter [Zalerion maritima]|uniref:C4-dicarboxylate transporter/malic acid transporter n=1 Tax=Zalerion maritima TaxID=339359 RepID=A0AAD5RIL8_9PEZI|nr:C4-dicarboxylate transporter/malic acid transporter [Zalerion maritima]